MKRVLVTGASSGIGLVCARGFLDRGCDVVAQYRRQAEPVKALVSEFGRERVSLVEANLKRADELIRDGEIFSALQMLEQACAIEARPSALLKLARLQLKNPKWDTKALRTLQKSLEADPNFIEAWQELADFWQRQDNTEHQRKALERVLSLDPNNPKATRDHAELTGKKPLSRLRKMMRLRKK